MVRMRGGEAREWIMFLVAIGLVIYFAVSRIELSPWWLMLLGAMLGLSVLVTGIQRSFGGGGKDAEPPAQITERDIKQFDHTPTKAVRKPKPKAHPSVDDEEEEAV